MIKEFTISIFTENVTGLMARVVAIFTRRHINIESLTTSRSSIPGIHRFTIVINVTEEQVTKLVAQIDKQVDVLKAFFYTNDEIVAQEIALYKIPTDAFSESQEMKALLNKHDALILQVEPEFTVLEKTGTPQETEALLDEIRKTGIYEFVRSGRVAIVKPMEQLNTYFNNIQNKFKIEQ
ncbi:MAG: acetolactate synthase small subunit [Bacteroidota bacterium]